MFRVIGTYLGTLGAGIVIGALVALLAMSDHQTEQVTGAAREVVAETAQNVVKAVEENTRIETKLDAVNDSAAAVKALVNSQMKPSKEVVYVEVKVPGKAEVQTCPSVGPDSVMPLSVAGVRLLNDMRAYRTVDITAINPSEIQASAGVTIAQFVNNDTDVVALYNDLATRHDELVDAVIDYMKKQAAAAEASK